MAKGRARRPSAVSRSNTLRFELGADDTVQTIHGGDAEPITFIEGCA